MTAYIYPTRTTVDSITSDWTADEWYTYISNDVVSHQAALWGIVPVHKRFAVVPETHVIRLVPIRFWRMGHGRVVKILDPDSI